MVTMRQGVIPQLFRQSADQHAERPAICSEHGVLTYRQLQESVDQVAQTLLMREICPGDRVVLAFDHGAAAVTALLGVLQSGATAVPMTLATPRDRCDRIIANVEPRALLAESDAVGAAWSRPEVAVIALDGLSPATRRAWPTAQPGDPASILFTSGSTGQPKGVVQTHRSILHSVSATTLAAGITAADRIAMFSNYAVGHGVSTMLGALLNGAALCVFDVRRHGFDRMARWLADERISIYVSSASLFRHLLRTAARSVHCADLRVIRLSSERVTREDVDGYRRGFASQARLLIAYSSTETSNIAMHVLDDDEACPGGVVPVGRPSAGVTVRIVDEHGRPQPDGEEGEIVVCGEHLPLGYWHDPERTAQIYSDCPEGPAVRCCRTLDIGRLRADGCLEVLGRRDRRVKIRGLRLELDEIELRLGQHPSVAGAAVVAPADERGDRVLAAYLELAAATTGGAVDDLRRFAAAHLPDYMVPSLFIVLDAIPRGSNGKIDRSRLPPLPRRRPALASAYVPPRSALERTIAEVWQDVLDLDGIGVHDPFLMLGGDSLRAAQVASRLSTALDRDVPLWELLEASTIDQMARLLEGRAITTTSHEY